MRGPAKGFLALKEFVVLDLAKKKKTKRYARMLHPGPFSHSHTLSSTGTTLFCYVS